MTSEKSKDCFCQKGGKCGEIAKGHFSKITETAHWEPPRKAAYSELSIAIHSISKADYVTAVLAIVRAELRAQEASSFCDFLKNDLLRFHLILLLFDSNVRRTIANMCPIMIHFNVLDFDESVSLWRSDKFLLTLSVYIQTGRLLGYVLQNLPPFLFRIISICVGVHGFSPL